MGRTSELWRYAAGAPVSDLAALQQYREQPMFSHWAPDVPDDRIAAAADTVKRLIDDVLALGANPQETVVRSAVGECVRRFNELDELDAKGWILTIEREDISEAIWRVVELAGFALDEGPDDSWTGVASGDGDSPAALPAVAPDRGGITIFQSSTSHQRPRLLSFDVFPLHHLGGQHWPKVPWQRK
jgi:hypothetical protein